MVCELMFGTKIVTAMISVGQSAGMISGNDKKILIIPGYILSVMVLDRGITLIVS
jgi:hypothetical protein